MTHLLSVEDRRLEVECTISGQVPKLHPGIALSLQSAVVLEEVERHFFLIALLQSPLRVLKGKLAGYSRNWADVRMEPRRSLALRIVTGVSHDIRLGQSLRSRFGRDRRDGF